MFNHVCFLVFKLPSLIYLRLRAKDVSSYSSLGWPGKIFEISKIMANKHQRIQTCPKGFLKPLQKVENCGKTAKFIEVPTFHLDLAPTGSRLFNLWRITESSTHRRSFDVRKRDPVVGEKDTKRTPTGTLDFSKWILIYVLRILTFMDLWFIYIGFFGIGSTILKMEHVLFKDQWKANLFWAPEANL